MNSQRSNRRSFLKNSSLGLLGAGLLDKNYIAKPSLEKDDELPKIEEYRTLGRTGFKVSDIGTGYPFSEAVLKAVLNTGVNFYRNIRNVWKGEK